MKEKYLLIRELLCFLEHVLKKGKVIIQIIKQHQLSGQLFYTTDEGFNRREKSDLLCLDDAVFVTFDNRVKSVDAGEKCITSKRPKISVLELQNSVLEVPFAPTITSQQVDGASSATPHFNAHFYAVMMGKGSR